MSLMDYVRSQPSTRRKPCLACHLPPEIQADIETGHANGVSYPMIRGFLKTQDVDMSEHLIKLHFKERHYANA